MDAVEEAQQANEAARQLLEQKKAEAEQLEREINRPIPQSELRSRESNIQDLIRRKQIEQVKQSNLQNLSQYKDELSQSEYGIQQNEQNISNYKVREKAYEMWKKGIPYGLVKGTPEYKYLKELWENGNYNRLEEERIKSRQEFNEAVKEIQNDLNVDKNTAIKIITNPNELSKFGQGMSRPEGEGYLVNNKFYITKPNEPKNINNGTSTLNNGQLVSGFTEQSNIQSRMVSSTNSLNITRLNTLSSDQVQKEKGWLQRYGKALGGYVASPFVSAGKVFYSTQKEGTLFPIPIKVVGLNQVLPKLPIEEPSSIDVLNTGSLLLPFTKTGRFILGTGGAIAVAKGVTSPTPENVAGATLGGLLLVPSVRPTKNFITDIWTTRKMTEIPASKVVAPEVLSYYNEGKGTLFPYDKPSTFKNWFESKNLKTYGLPDIPNNLRNKPFGYSATSSGGIVEKTGIGEAGQFYSGKGVSIAFLRLGKDKSIIGQDFAFGDKPFVYALYGKGTKVVPKAYEIKVPNPYETGGKPIKKYIFPNVNKKGGIFYIPTNKPEVQAVVYGSIIPVRKQFYFKLGGRRVPIGEYISSAENLGKDIISDNIKPEKQQSSILPYKQKSSNRPINLFSSLKSSVSSSFKKFSGSNSFSSSTSNSKSSITSSVVSGKSSNPSPSQPQSSIVSLRSSTLPSYSLSRSPNYYGSSNSFNSFGSGSSSIISPPPPSRSVYKTSKGKIVKVGSRYIIFVKKYGQDIIIGEANTLEEAKDILTNYLKTTLRASGFITLKQTGQKQNVKDLFGSMFTSSKKDNFRLVQRVGKRLSSKNEVAEIFGLKRTKSAFNNTRKSRRIKWW